jgi:hypothetical protein
LQTIPAVIKVNGEGKQTSVYVTQRREAKGDYEEEWGSVPERDAAVFDESVRAADKCEDARGEEEEGRGGRGGGKDTNVDRFVVKETERASGERTRVGLDKADVPDGRNNVASVEGFNGFAGADEDEVFKEEVECRVRRGEEEERARTAWHEGGCNANEIVGGMQ